MSSKVSFVLIVTVIVLIGVYMKTNLFASKPVAVPNSLYDIHMKSLDGKDVDFNQYKGKKLLIVNTASKCGKTPQYTDLQKLHEQYGNKVTVLGFPANNFLWQEPGTSAEIAAFCEKNYGVTFQMFEKISVKGGDQAPLYSWLQGQTGEKPDWNFAKYLVNEDGTKVEFFKSSVEPLDQKITKEIQ